MAITGVSYTAFLAIGWGLAGLGALVVAGRYIIRIRMRRKLQGDDFAQGVALLSYMAFMALYSLFIPTRADVYLAAAHEGVKLTPNQVLYSVHLFVAADELFWVTVYSAKLTFMLFYHSLFRISVPFTRAWWAIMGYLIVSFLAALLTPYWTCGTPADIDNAYACTSLATYTTTINYSKVMVALNIAGDVAIMILPLSMLRKLNIKMSQKVGLAFIFLLGLIIIILDLLRVLIGGYVGAVTLAPLWNILQPAVAVIVAALPTYRAILHPPRKSQAPTYYAYTKASSEHSGSPNPASRTHHSYNASQQAWPKSHAIGAQALTSPPAVLIPHGRDEKREPAHLV